MSDFILRHLVREVLAERVSPDPGVVATEVLARIPRGALRSALKQTMRLYVRQVISEGRGNNRPSPVTPIKANRSAKVAAIRDGWQKHLDDEVHVGSSVWKYLRHCTYDDLLAAAGERREEADRNQAVARTYDSWARLVSEHEVDTFGDLPVEIQMQALGRVA